MNLYPHQQQAIDMALPILNQYKLVYLVMEVRTGKTLTAFEIAALYVESMAPSHLNNVGFITKKKAIPSIEADYKKAGFDQFFTLHCMNYEQIKNMPVCDVYIIDEAHSCGQYPKPSIRTKSLKERINGQPCILLSGTPTPESFSQIFHQLWITGNSPFPHKNFYDWARKFVTVKQKMIGGFRINDYSRANDEAIKNVCGHLLVSCSQVDAGFTIDVEESFVKVTMNDVSKYFYKTLEKDQVVEWKGITFIADTPANMLNKFSQIAGGTIIQTDIDAKQTGHIIDDAKAVYIRDNYVNAGLRVAIYYRYKAELILLQSFFHNHTQDWTAFESGSNPIFLSQIQSGREGISLRSADLIIMYNIDFSATSYWQVRARMQYKDRTTPAKVVWLFSDLGIEEKVYKAVSNKKNFTVSYYKKISNVRKQSANTSKKEVGESRVVCGKDNELFPSWLAGSASHEKRETFTHRSESTGQRADTITEGKTRTVTSSWF